ncbi:M20/M25/M40 family metallo-hydrolase [Antarcticibacterium arcticum]|uniref:M20/M25/M40 family metallo-hydrolase n=1 Tax=Antarcticibacterium arcticum TaxID=2585771 RepID=A0A5B8YLU5_9FLAO|nr:M28 family metallopeptidase [Antarcticibacterium arcticum]QED37603.1 M20/M25/M40 family metallo-hydrolase [Antarcticibacterium arcticum]
MKKLILSALTISLLSCGVHQQNKVENADVMKYANTITAGELSEHLYIFASDEFEGRNTGEPGQKKAAQYLVNEYKKLNIPSPAGVTNYYQPVPSTAFRGNVKDSENVLAFLEGSEFPEEVLVISSHYDHVGMDAEGNVFNGADDDGSGTVAILEIADAFMQAKADGFHPKRSILFLNVTGEEKGLIGSKWYTDNPVFPLVNTIANLNIDMIGRIGNGKEDAGDYVYLIGSDKLSTELHNISEEINAKYINMELDYTYNDENDPNRFYYRSDHYNFAKNNIPIIFYFNGVHADYHKITDTPDKIEYDLLAKRAQLVFLTAWEVANRDTRPVVDKPVDAAASAR